jgi:purine-binding chemotaxis protein CheW
MGVAWLRFGIAGLDFAIPLGSVSEVTQAARPHLIPGTPLDVGGILNVRGEPLPVVDGGVLLIGRPAPPHQHILVLDDGRIRAGVLVGRVARIQAELPATRLEGPPGPDTEAPFVEWVESRGQRVGRVAPDAFLEQAAARLTAVAGLRRGGEACHTAF